MRLVVGGRDDDIDGASQDELCAYFHSLGVPTEELHLDVNKGFQLKVHDFYRWAVGHSYYTGQWVVLRFNRIEPLGSGLLRWLRRQPRPTDYSALTYAEFSKGNLHAEKGIFQTWDQVDDFVLSICPGVDRDDFEAAEVRAGWNLGDGCVDAGGKLETDSGEATDVNRGEAP